MSDVGERRIGIPLLLTVVLAIQVLSVASTITLENVLGYEPQDVSLVVATGESARLILLIFVMSSALAALVVLKRRTLFKFFITVFAVFGIWLITLLYVGFFLGDLAGIAFATLAAAGLVYATIRRKPDILSLYAVASTVAFIPLFVLNMPLNVLLIFSVALSLYDIFAVFVGPLRFLLGGNPPPKKVEPDKKTADLGIMVMQIAGVALGTGDLMLYSLVASMGYFMKGVLGVLAVLITVPIGLTVTLLLLKRYSRPIPALPIPVLLSIAALLLI